MKTILSSACILALAGCAEQERDSQSTAFYPNYYRSQIETPSEAYNDAYTEHAMAQRQLALERQQEQGAFSSVIENPPPESSPNPGSVTYVAPTQVTPQPEPLTPPPQVGERTTTGPAPLATPVAGKPGYVLSPFAPQAGYVDVTGLAPGTEAKDPYTGKIFRVP